MHLTCEPEEKDEKKVNDEVSEWIFFLTLASPSKSLARHLNMKQKYHERREREKRLESAVNEISSFNNGKT